MAFHLSQLGASEWHMALHTVQGSDALLECKQTLVDLSTLQPCLPVIVVCVCIIGFFQDHNETIQCSKGQLSDCTSGLCALGGATL